MDMDVPDHLYLHGQRFKGVNRNSATFGEMFVPDKIVVGTDGRLVPHPSQPMEERISPVPDKLTANEYPAEIRKKKVMAPTKFLNESQDSLHAAESLTNLNSSLAVDLDPLRELKNVRRQLGRLATRVLELEDENQRRTVREYGLWSVLTGSLVVLAFILGRK